MLTSVACSARPLARWLNTAATYGSAPGPRWLIAALSRMSVTRRLVGWAERRTKPAVSSRSSRDVTGDGVRPASSRALSPPRSRRWFNALVSEAPIP